MLKLFKEFNKSRERKKALQEFSGEVDKNLERYYVMFQINRLRFFDLAAWEKVKILEDVRFADPVTQYVQRLQKYNEVLKDFKDYEEWYSSDSANKTRENGSVLNQKNTRAKEEFQGLEDVIKTARDSVNKLAG